MDSSPVSPGLGQQGLGVGEGLEILGRDQVSEGIDLVSGEGIWMTGREDFGDYLKERRRRSRRRGGGGGGGQIRVQVRLEVRGGRGLEGLELDPVLLSGLYFLLSLFGAKLLAEGVPGGEGLLNGPWGVELSQGRETGLHEDGGGLLEGQVTSLVVVETNEDLGLGGSLGGGSRVTDKVGLGGLEDEELSLFGVEG